MYNAIHFLLTPDRSASRRLRRIVAEDGARIGVMAGTWHELIPVLLHAYRLPEPLDSWETAILASAREMKDAFWSRSLEVAEKETLAVVGGTLAKLLEGRGPNRPLSPDESGCLPERARRHLHDLVRLHEASGALLPAPLAAMSLVLSAPLPITSRQVVVYHQSRVLPLSPWQKALLEKVAADCTIPPDPHLENLQCASCEMPGSEGGALSHIQNHLFSAPSGKVERDASIQWVAARDYLEEVEVVAGMIQNALRQDPSLRYGDMALLLPRDPVYQGAVRAVFASAGLPLSAPDAETSIRDIGRETVFHFLLTLKGPAPAMARAALVTSPLMPWTAEKGNYLADRIMNGDGEVDELRNFERFIAGEAALPADLDAALLWFSRFLRAGEGMETHLGRGRQAISRVREMLHGMESVPWERIRAVAAPESCSGKGEGSLTREGIALFDEGEEPWRRVRNLFVLGFTSGHYPLLPGASALFAESDLELLNERLGYAVETRTGIARRRRELFRRQLLSASGHVTLLMPRRDGMGESIHASESLTFMAQLVDGVTSPDDIVLDLDRGADRERVWLLARAPEAMPTPPRALVCDDIRLPHNLLKLRSNADGEQKPESPSGLETLMVSPLAWLFRRFTMEPKEWAPEELDTMGKGTLAHGVFEQLFAPGLKIPDSEEIRSRVPLVLQVAVEEVAPFMLLPEWRVELRHLEREILEAALRWGEVLLRLKAEVMGVEVKLHGWLDDLPLTGNADLLLKLPGNRMYIVDYKKSKSRARRERMSKGYDSQAHLYRLMLRTGGAEEGSAMASAGEIGVLYYMLNDQTALADTSGWSGGTLGGFHELGNDISANAMELIRERIAQLEKGIVALNGAEDGKWFEKTAGMKPYALDTSPLIRLFLKDDV